MTAANLNAIAHALAALRPIADAATVGAQAALIHDNLHDVYQTDIRAFQDFRRFMNRRDRDAAGTLAAFLTKRRSATAQARAALASLSDDIRAGAAASLADGQRQALCVYLDRVLDILDVERNHPDERDLRGAPPYAISAFLEAGPEARRAQASDLARFADDMWVLLLPARWMRLTAAYECIAAASHDGER